jgi:hypothetical protein
MAAGTAVAGAGLGFGTLLPGASAQPLAGDATLEELKVLLREANETAFRVGAEGLRRAAAVMRLYAAHLSTTTLDRDLKASLREIVRERGRGFVLAAEPNHAKMQTELQAYGIPKDQLIHFDHGAIGVAERERALDALLASPAPLRDMFRRTAEVLDQQAQRAQRAGMARLVAMQTTTCDQLKSTYESMLAFAGIICAMAEYIPQFIPGCGAALGAAAGMFASWLLCQNFGF